jgi:hypothetical protein
MSPLTPFLSAVGEKRSTLHFEGSNFFRVRLSLSLLSGKAITIGNIRGREEDPGIKEYEASLIRLVDKMTNGSKIEINETGTRKAIHQIIIMTLSGFQDPCRQLTYLVLSWIVLGRDSPIVKN